MGADTPACNLCFDQGGKAGEHCLRDLSEERGLPPGSVICAGTYPEAPVDTRKPFAGPDYPDSCTCWDCGYTWKRGQNGYHSCAEELQRRLAELSAQLADRVSRHEADARDLDECRRLKAEETADASKAWGLVDTLADALETIWDATCGLDIACEFCKAAAPTCAAGPTGPILHKEKCPRAAVESALRGAGRLPGLPGEEG
jgi:hypothetical protein